MRYQEKTREELILLLEKLENELELLKSLHKKDKPGNAEAEKSHDLPGIEINGKEDAQTPEFYLANPGKTYEIDNLRQAGQKLKESEEKFRNVFEYSIVGNSITTIDGRLQTNKAYCDILGYSANELNNIPWMEITHPEDVQANLETINSLLRGEKNSARWEKRYLHKNGSIVWVDINTTLQRDAHGEPLCFITSIIDITSRVQVEEKLTDNNSRLELAMKSANMAWWEMDIRTGGVIFNQRKAEMLGYLSENFKHYNDFMALVHPEDSVRLMNAMHRHIDGTAEKYEAEYRILSQSGEYMWFYDIGTVVKRDDLGLPLQVSGLVIDISRRKEAEEELIKAKVNAEESDRLKSAFLANMSHEIRTPMNGIMGFIELLKEPNLTGTEQQAYIQVIVESGDRMLNLMNNLIDISRIESGEIKLLISHYDIKKQLDKIFNFFVPEANKKGIKLLRTHNLSHAESMIKTDMQKLDAILINLVKNAIKFTRNGSVEFGCTRLGDNFRFFVKDSGVGIDSGYQEIIFDRFRQANESLSRPYEGAGLGLSISKAFIEALGGKIWVDSELGVGSTFYFILPGDINETYGIPVQKTAGRPKTANLTQELKVLIVEDDETSMNYMEIIAGSFCTKYLKASTGRDAVDIFRVNQDINLILMDIKMPVMDGLEATRLIRQINSDVVIIAQTAYSMVGDKEKALEAGCNDYISKPVNKDQLKELIQLHTKY